MSLNDSLKKSILSSPCHLIIFGATGDLTLRKLLPALYLLEKSQALPQKFSCIAFARREKTTASYTSEVKKSLKEHLGEKIDEKVWARFSKKLHYHLANFDDQNGFDSLQKKLKSLEKNAKSSWIRIFYLCK